MDCVVHGVTKSWTRLSNFHLAISTYQTHWSKKKNHNFTITFSSEIKAITNLLVSFLFQSRLFYHFLKIRTKRIWGSEELVFVETFCVQALCFVLCGYHLVQFSQSWNVGGIISILNLRKVSFRISNLPRSHRHVLKKILKFMSNSKLCYFHCVDLCMKSHLYLIVMLVSRSISSTNTIMVISSPNLLLLSWWLRW